MSKFVLITKSESCDDYVYFIENEIKPTIDQLNKWLMENGSDVDEYQCYENIISITELPNTFKKL